MGRAQSVWGLRGGEDKHGENDSVIPGGEESEDVTCELASIHFIQKSYKAK